MPRSPFALLTLMLVACGSSETPIDDGREVTDASVPSMSDAGGAESLRPEIEIEEFFVRSCSGGNCHNPSVTSEVTGARLDLSAGVWFDSIVSRTSAQVDRMKLIAPGTAAESYLFRKVEGSHPTLPECASRPSPCGRRMPLTGPNWPVQEDLDRLRSWIERRPS